MCIKYIIQLAKIALSKYPTTLNEDIEMINSRIDFSENEHNCILMRISEKKVLEFYKNFGEYTLDLIEKLDLNNKNWKENKKIKFLKKKLLEKNNDQNYLHYYENTLFTLINDYIK